MDLGPARFVNTEFGSGLRKSRFKFWNCSRSKPGNLVTRRALCEKLWPDTFVGYEHCLNTAINKVRDLLGDSAQNPRFVETIPRRGYRFVLPVERVTGPGLARRTDDASGTSLQESGRKPGTRPLQRWPHGGADSLSLVDFSRSVWVVIARTTAMLLQSRRTRALAKSDGS